METAGKDDMPEDAERKGLGTPATRAGILEKLVSTGFLERRKSKKTVQLTELYLDNKAPGPQETIVAKSTRPSVLEGLRRPMPPRAADKKSKTHEEVR